MPDVASERVLLKVRQPYGNHNGGQIAFGPDGFLYIGMGDGGGANNPKGNGQDLSTLLGALLRIDADGSDDTEPYGIPADNPFIRVRHARPEIWAYGLRNPWRFSFDVSGGALWLADVGQDDAEEIDIVERGGNYGWNIMEGDACTPAVNRNCSREGLAMPVYVYRHPRGFAVTGGFVYRGGDIPGLCGVYLFADYVSGHIWGLRRGNGRVSVRSLLLDGSGLGISSFGQDERLELYVADHRGGRIWKIIADRRQSDGG